MQEHFAAIQFVTPDDDGPEGERALAQAGDHRLAAGLYTLGDSNLALAREQPTCAHLWNITSVQRRRRWTASEKVRMVDETFAPGMTVSLVARRHGVAPNQPFTWRRLAA